MNTSVMKTFWRQTFALDANSGNGGGASLLSAAGQGDAALGDVRKSHEQAQALLRAQCAATLGATVPTVRNAVRRAAILRSRRGRGRGSAVRGRLMGE